MKTEKLTYSESNRSLNIVANQVESLRINDSVQYTCRVYEGGNIGVEGCLGSVDWPALEQAARAKLAQGIAYPETHGERRTLTVDSTAHILDNSAFIPAVQHLLARLAEENPQFLFSNKVQLNSSQSSYESSDGEHYLYRGNQLVVALAIKLKGSANIMDESYACESSVWDEDDICRDVGMVCNAFLSNLPQLEQDEVTVIGGLEPLQYAISHFVADMYFNNASLLAGKLGQKLFNDKLTVLVDRNPAVQLNLPFFDAEGTVNEGYQSAIVQNGVLRRLVTCKRSAVQYGTDNLGSAGAAYNGVPNAGLGGWDVADTADSLAQLVQGDAVYLSETGGGDMTPDGDISIPVLCSYLYRDGRPVGRLPEFTVCGNLFSLLGENFVGVTQKGLFRFGRQKHLVYRAKLVNKQ